MRLKSSTDAIAGSIAALAVSVAFSALCIAGGLSDSSKYASQSSKHSSPDYWHYQHHWNAGAISNCTSSCQFTNKSLTNATSSTASSDLKIALTRIEDNQESFIMLMERGETTREQEQEYIRLISQNCKLLRKK